jgi:Holliday junction resolvasome RuvABC endonuclease subunit
VPEQARVRTFGCDLSLNHGACVALDNGKLAGFWYYTSLAGSAARSPLGKRLPVWDPKKMDRHNIGMNRLAWVEAWFKRTITKVAPDYANIEDYALDVDHGIAYQGEVGGAARLVCWHAGVALRLTDPTSVKMYGALKGNADKDAVEQNVMSDFGVDFGSFNGPVAPKAKKENRQTSQDLCDAFVLAHLCWAEVRLRAGELRLAELHPKRIQVFNRITKAQPTGLLDRDWIKRPEAV